MLTHRASGSRTRQVRMWEERGFVTCRAVFNKQSQIDWFPPGQTPGRWSGSYVVDAKCQTRPGTPLLILILGPSIIITRRLVRFVSWLISIGFFALVRLGGIVWGRCLIGFILFLGLSGLIRLSSLFVRLSVNDRWIGA